MKLTHFKTLIVTVMAATLVLGLSPAGATTTDGDVVLGVAAQPTCNPGIDANCENAVDGTIVVNQFGHALTGEAIANGDGVQGITESSGFYGVYGKSPSTAVIGYGNVGVDGFSEGAGNGVQGEANSGANGVYGHNSGAGNGVQGDANNAAASGVYGSNGGSGFGVAGRAVNGFGVLGDSANGTGVWANSQSGTALKVTGKVQLSRSGKAVVAGSTSSPRSSVVVQNVSLTSRSLVMTTAQMYVAGVSVAAAVPNVSGGSITIYLNEPVTVSFPIAWMVIEHG